MASTDRPAATLLRQLRTDAGLSPEALSHELLRAQLGYVSGKTIRRIEFTGNIPTPRVQFAIARYFGRAPSQLWTGGRSHVPAERVAA